VPVLTTVNTVVTQLLFLANVTKSVGNAKVGDVLVDWTVLIFAILQVLSRFEIEKYEGLNLFWLFARNFLLNWLNVADMCVTVIIDFAHRAIELIANVPFSVTTVDQLLAFRTTLELFANR